MEVLRLLSGGEKFTGLCEGGGVKMTGLRSSGEKFIGASTVDSEFDSSSLVLDPS